MISVLGPLATKFKVSDEFQKLVLLPVPALVNVPEVEPALAVTPSGKPHCIALPKSKVSL